MPTVRFLVPAEQRRRVSRGWRRLRAAGRNMLALWNEFRVSITVFLVAVIVGGWIYGELWVQAGYERIAPVDLPYTMLSLMVLQPPHDIPPDSELIVFWYAMPLIGVYVAARGALDFVELFFSPDKNRNAWEEAVASTYRNHVIVLGVGHLGTRVVRSLAKMGFDTVAIDAKSDPVKAQELDALGVPLVIGDGRLASTLDAAGVRKAQALIVCTSNDHMNLEVTMRARDLNPGVRIVVRMWDDQFAGQIQNFLNVEAVLSATDIAAPSFAASALGIEITQSMNVHGVEYSMIRLEVAPGSFLDGKTIGALQDDEHMDIVLHGAPDRVEVHPAADAIVRAGDTLVLFAQHGKITEVVARNRQGAVQTIGLASRSRL